MSDELSLRAGQLRSPGKRAGLACALEGVVELAAQPPAPWGAKMPLERRTEVQACRSTLLKLAECLRADAPLRTPGIAMTSLLICDGRSPLYSRAESFSLTDAALSALAAVEPLRA